MPFLDNSDRSARSSVASPVFRAELGFHLQKHLIFFGKSSSMEGLFTGYTTLFSAYFFSSTLVGIGNGTSIARGL
jgi:hypothetical protein